MRKKDDQKQFNLLTFLLHSSIGIAVWMFFLLISSVLIFTETLSTEMINQLVCVSVFSGSITASFLSAVKFGKKLLSALLQGFIYFILLSSLGILIYGRLLPESASLAIPISCFLGSLSGAVISAFFKINKR